MQKVIARKNVFVKILFVNGTSDYNYDINIDFEPDEMIVKSVNYINDGTEALVDYVYSSLITDIICSIVDTKDTYNPFTSWSIKKPVKGIYRFSLIDVNNAAVSDRQGILSLHLEFVKYA